MVVYSYQVPATANKGMLNTATIQPWPFGTHSIGHCPVLCLDVNSTLLVPATDHNLLYELYSWPVCYSH